MQKTYKIGVDIGGTKMIGVLLDDEKIITDCLLATPKDDANHFFIMLKALVEPLLEKARKDGALVSGVGISVAGVLDYTIGKMVLCPNIPILNGLKILERASKFISLPMVIDNDVKCFVRAETEIGYRKKYDNVFGIAVGTGIGGGWYFNGEVYHGANGGAGEIGEIADFNTGVTLEAAYHNLMNKNPKDAAMQTLLGDEMSKKAYEDFGNILGIALANAVNLMDPAVIIIGGGALESSHLFLDITRSKMHSLIASDKGKKIKLLKSKLGAHACAIGAAMLLEKMKTMETR